MSGVTDIAESNEYAAKGNYIMTHLGLSLAEFYQWLNGKGEHYVTLPEFTLWLKSVQGTSFVLPELWAKELDNAYNRTLTQEQAIYCPFTPEARQLAKRCQEKWDGLMPPPEEPDWMAIARADSRLQALAAERGRVIDAADVREICTKMEKSVQNC
jgi:hypothetical protein